jgi:hypothetical protein
MSSLRLLAILTWVKSTPRREKVIYDYSLGGKREPSFVDCTVSASREVQHVLFNILDMILKALFINLWRSK